MNEGMLSILMPAVRKFHPSYVPDQEILGVIIPHGEAVTLTRFLTLPDYRPTMHYVY